jgi:kynurenine formamidase
MIEGIGTHIDAPAHFLPGGVTIDELPLASLIRPCLLLDVSRAADERYRVSRKDVEDFERQWGVINAGSFVMVRTGWERHWHTPEKYRNDYVFPSVSTEAAEVLVERGIAGIGIDTLSPDRPEHGFPVHKVMLGAGKYIVENAATLIGLPPRGGWIATLPLKTKNGTEAPVRLLGLTPLVGTE